ncbi:MAG: flagellar assembly protein FliW [Planctomycetes bacterium]|nr:flagellar assembly protein FliW [Planctomycetota bacterium]
MVIATIDLKNPIRIETSRFGPMDVDASMVFSFPEGLIGLPHAQAFAILDDANGPLQWMQSLDDPRLAFVIVEPVLFAPDYRVRVIPAELAAIELDRPEDSRVSVILSIPADPSQMTANLQGPLVFNTVRNLGKQLVLAEYTTKHKVIA